MFSPDVEPKRRLSRRIGKENYEAICQIYFIEAMGLGVVKIGYARDVEKRFVALLTASPAALTLRGVLPGGPQREREIHEQLGRFRLQGEWFEKSPEVEALIATAAPTRDSKFWNRIAAQRGEALMGYLAKMKAGEVARPTRGPSKRRNIARPGYDQTLVDALKPPPPSSEPTWRDYIDEKLFPQAKP